MLHKILVVDDNQLILLTTSLLLKQNGMAVEAVPGGREGLESIDASIPDLVLLDIMMPEMDGWEMLRRLRTDERFEGLPVVVFTAAEGELTLDEAKRRGAQDILRKPFHLDQLLRTLHRQLAEKRHG